MQIVINQRNLFQALRTVERMVAKNISLPILNTVLLKTENGRLRLAATNLEVGMNYWVGAKVIQEGEIAIPVRVFSDFISNITDEKLTLKTEKQVITINSDHYQSRILGLDTKEFPIIPKVQKTVELKLDATALRTALGNVLDSVATSESRPELSGVFINITPKQVEFAATDTFRLAEKVIPLKDGITRSLIVPRLTAIELMRLAEENPTEISLAIGDNQLFVKGENFEFISRLIDGHYPEYKRVIPEKFISLARISKQELEHSVKIASIFSSSIADIKLQASDGQLQIEAKNADRGELNTSINCALKNEPFSVAVNFRYLLDGLKTMPTDNVVLHYTGEGSPLVIKGEEKKDQTYLIMPLRS